MAKHVRKDFGDDDYFAEPDYDRLTDEQLDELYYFGELRTPIVKREKSRKKSRVKKQNSISNSYGELENWRTIDFDEDDDLFDES